MKKLYKLSLLVFIPVIGGIILNVVGTYTENENVSKAGSLLLSAGVPITMFILVVIGLILMITGNLRDKNTKNADINSDINIENTDEKDEFTSEPNEDPARTREEEYSEIEDVNSSYNLASQIKQGEYMSRHVADNYKNSNEKEKIFGWIFFGFLITDFILIPVFAFLNILVGAIVCFCLFCGTIIISGIVKAILERSSMKFDIRKAKTRRTLDGEVKACLLSSTTSIGGAHRHSTTRITRVVYRVIVTAEEKDYTAYSKTFYETGDRVEIAVIGKSRAAILEEETEQTLC